MIQNLKQGDWVYFDDPNGSELHFKRHKRYEVEAIKREGTFDLITEDSYRAVCLNDPIVKCAQVGAHWKRDDSMNQLDRIEKLLIEIRDKL